VLTTPQIHDTLAFVIDRLPPLLHLVVISRSDPPLPLARLRASGALCELHADDLRFSRAETAAFVAQSLPGSLPPETIARLDERAEGWAAGLRLATIALRGRAHRELSAILDSFHGSQQPVAEYLVADVLDGQPAPIQLFLLQTSMLDRLSAALCDAVTGGSDSAALLLWIEQANLFLTPLDDVHGWHRYHALFAEAMRHAAAQRLGDEALRACYARASVWYEQHGMLNDAIEAALGAQLWARAVALIEPLLETLHLAEAGEPRTMRRWLEQLPQAALHGNPALCFGYGLALLHTSDRRAIAAELAQLDQLAEQGWRREHNLPKLGQLFAARALQAFWNGSMEQAIRCARQAIGWLPAADVTWRAVCLGFIGKADLQDGKLDAARHTLLEARALSEASGLHHATRAHMLMLGDISAGQGELHQAEALYQQALADALEHADRSDQGPARLGLARLAYEWNDLETAEREALAARDLGQQIAHEPLQVRATLALARIEQARGAPQRAQQLLGALLARLSPHRAPLLYREILAEQARLRLASGDLATAQRWLATRTDDRANLPPPLQEQEDLLVARVLIARGDASAALRLLDQRLPAALADGRLRSALEIQLVIALACAAADRIDEAGRITRQALTQTHASSYCRLFLDEGAALAALLRQLISDVGEPALRSFANRLIQLLLLEQAALDLAPALSRQERRVLALLAAGGSNPEIAQELIVSVNTIKTQLKQIYRKLRVSSREEACAVARHLRLV
jgi:LuxR family maltose regulon positive regulatory protein